MLVDTDPIDDAFFALAVVDSGQIMMRVARGLILERQVGGAIKATSAFVEGVELVFERDGKISATNVETNVRYVSDGWWDLQFIALARQLEQMSN